MNGDSELKIWTELASGVREKYPDDYADLSDEELASSVLRRYPVYASRLKNLPPGFDWLKGRSSGDRNFDDAFIQSGLKYGVSPVLLLETERQTGFRNRNPESTARAMRGFLDDSQENIPLALARFTQSLNLSSDADKGSRFVQSVLSGITGESYQDYSENWFAQTLNEIEQQQRRNPQTDDWFTKTYNEIYGSGPTNQNYNPTPPPVQIGYEDIQHHLGLDATTFSKLGKPLQQRIFDVVTTAATEDKQKRNAGQKEFPVSPTYQAEMRQRVGLTPAAMVALKQIPDKQVVALSLLEGYDGYNAGRIATGKVPLWQPLSKRIPERIKGEAIKRHQQDNFKLQLKDIRSEVESDLRAVQRTERRFGGGVDEQTLQQQIDAETERRFNKMVEAEQRKRNILENLTPEENRQLNEWTRELRTGGYLRGLEQGFSGSVARLDQAASLLPVVGDTYERLAIIRNEAARRAQQETPDESLYTQGTEIVGGLPLDLLRIGAVTAVTRNPMLGFAADSAIQTAGSGGDTKQVLEAGTKGALEGLVFHGANTLTSQIPNRALRVATQIPISGVPAVAIEKAFGASDSDALKAGLVNAAFGAVPTRLGKSELKTKSPVGADTSPSSPQTPTQRILSTVLDIWNIPRTIKTSFDLSAPGRQGIVLSAAHPVAALRAGFKQFKSLFSEKNYDDFKRELRTNKNFAVAEDSGVYFGSSNEDAALLTREENFMSDIARNVPGVRASERAFITYLDHLRLEVYTQYADTLKRNGITPELNPKAYKDAARFVNFATGRGVGKLADAIAPVGNLIFFSPRNMVARFQLLNPKEYYGFEPEVRKLAVKELLKFTGTLSLFLTMAKLAGADVTLNPEDSDFGKIRVDNKTVYDVSGQVSTPLRYFLQLTAALKRSIDGERQPYNKKPSDLVKRFFRAQLNPSASYILDTSTGENFIGQKVDVPNETLNLIAPLFMKDLYEGLQEEGLKGGLKSSPALFGVGVQRYEKKKQSRYTQPPQRRANTTTPTRNK